MKLTLLGIFSLSFPLTHILLSHGSIRGGLIAKLGRWPFRALYSVISFITLGGTIWLFGLVGQAGPVLWDLPRWLDLAVALPLILFAFALFALLMANPSPTGMLPAKKEVRGVLRISRHPMNMAFAALSLAHIVTTPNLANLFFFGSFFVTAVVGAFHQDARIARERSASYEAFRNQTSVLPFVAILRRRTTFEPSELSLPLVLLGAALFVTLLFVHERLFGIAPF